MPNLKLQKNDLTFLRTNIQEKFKHETEQSLVTNTYAQSYAILADTISEYAENTNERVSDRQLLKLFSESKESEQETFRDDFVRLCCLFISSGQHNSIIAIRKSASSQPAQNSDEKNIGSVTKTHLKKYRFAYIFLLLAIIAFGSPYLTAFAKIYFDKGSMPIVESKNQLLLHDVIEKLEFRVEGDWQKRDHDCWNTSEIYLSLRKDLSDTSNFHQFYQNITTHYDSIYPGWKSSPAEKNKSPKDMRTTAWVLLTENTILTKSNFPDLVKKIIANQNSEGAWTTFAVNDTTEAKNYSSTYSTCYTLLFLNQIFEKTNDLVLKKQIEEAIKRSVLWLLKTQLFEQGKPIARWKDYPLHLSGKKLDAISALVIHTLNKVNYSKVTEINDLWLKNCPPYLDCIFLSDDAEMEYPSRVYNERTKTIRNIYIAISLCDIYSKSTIANKLKINVLINDFVRKLSEANLDKMPDESIVPSFRKAELLIALKYIAGNKLI